jgi:hypothetical protein
MGVGSAATVSAQNATRALPDDYTPGATFAVSIAVNPPAGTAVAGFEERSPLGWAVSNISHSGTFDAQSQKVKWGPFFSTSIPSSLTYDVKPSGGASGEQCFTGTASFDGLDQPIGGEQCLPRSVLTLSGVGMAGLTLSLLLAGAIILSRTKQAVFPDR